MIYEVLKNYCAIIFSGVSLYNGIDRTAGLAAVFGEGQFAHSLYMEGVIEGQDGLNHWKKTLPGQLTMLDSKKKVASYCVSERIGVKGLKIDLKNLGFLEASHVHEKNTATNYMKELKKVNAKVQIIKSHEPIVGRSIAAAITMGQVNLSGKYACACNPDYGAPFNLQMDEPLDMGFLKLIARQIALDHEHALVYLNGNLRLLEKDLTHDHQKLIWDIHPKLKNIKSYSPMNRKRLDIFLYNNYIRKTNTIDTEMNLSLVLLGECNNSKYSSILGKRPRPYH